LDALEELSLYENGFTGEVPECILKMKSLKQLLLQKNHFTGFGCAVSSADNAVEEGRYSSSCPLAIEWPRLQRLDISDNDFTGATPDIEIGNGLVEYEFYIYLFLFLWFRILPWRAVF
jgi:hypothetical protein